MMACCDGLWASQAPVISESLIGRGGRQGSECHVRRSVSSEPLTDVLISGPPTPRTRTITVTGTVHRDHATAAGAPGQLDSQNTTVTVTPGDSLALTNLQVSPARGRRRLPGLPTSCGLPGIAFEYGRRVHPGVTWKPLRVAVAFRPRPLAP
jgi:hypothetical protein